MIVSNSINYSGVHTYTNSQNKTSGGVDKPEPPESLSSSGGADKPDPPNSERKTLLPDVVTLSKDVRNT